MLSYGILLLCVSSALARYRIINGVDSNISDNPHQVSLQYISSSCTTAGSGICHICGGSIVNSRWILTAAHCVEGGSPGQYLVGAEFTEGLIRSESYTRFEVTRIIMHPQYNAGQGAFPNDVALLKLATPIDLVNTPQKAISLAQSGDNFNYQTCTISGWGLTSDDVIPDRLQSTTGTIDPNCGAWQSNNHNPTAHICINNQATGSCNGDSGGPMVCGGKLAGVTSWGASGCSTSYPSVYARVSTYNAWIMDTIAAN